MQLLNDKKDELQSQPLDLLRIAVVVISNCAVSASVVGAPLAMLYSHRVLVHPSSKVAAILGVALANPVFGIPASVLIVQLMMGLVLQSFTEKNYGFGKVIWGTTAVSALTGVAMLFLGALRSGLGPLVYWNSITELIASRIIDVFPGVSLGVESLANLVALQMPFAIISLVILSVWLSIGVASHLNWFETEHSLSGKTLRKHRWGRWLPISFILLFLSRIIFRKFPLAFFLSGLESILMILLYVQGCIVLSGVFSLRRMGFRFRTVLYLFFASIGFYVSVILGLIFLAVPRWGRMIFFRRCNCESNIA